jgi:hypothetical protein
MCKVMSHPTYEATDVAYHMIRYCVHTLHELLRHRRIQNTVVPAEADSSCVMCSTCPVGEGVISAACTATSNTVCEACSKGSSFSAVSSDVACETCATCPAGEGVARWVRVQCLYSLP